MSPKPTQSKARAKARAKVPQTPNAGGSYTRDPKSGKLTAIPTAQPDPAPESEPKPEAKPDAKKGTRT